MYIRFNSSCCKTFLVYFISFFIIYTPTLVFAGAAEKWEILENVYDTSKNTVNLTAKKPLQAAANSGRYKVEIPVNSATLGNTAKRMLWIGASVAAISALVEGVGWIIDTGSQVIKRETPDSASDPARYQYRWRWDYSLPQFDCYTASSCVAAGNAMEDYVIKNGTPEGNRIVWDKCVASGSNYYCTGKLKATGSARNMTIPRSANPAYNPDASKQYEYMSDTQLGDEILGKGTEPNSKTAPSPDIITDAYDPNNPASDAPAPHETNQALENANPEPETPPKGDSTPKPNTDTDGDGKPDAYDPAKPSEGTDFTLPVFCSWAPAVCEFFKVQKQDNIEIKENQKEDIAQNKTFFEKVSDWFDWTKEDNSTPDTPDKPEIQEPNLSIGVTNYIQFGSQCPQDRQIPLSMGGQTLNLVISYQPLCIVAEQFRPAVILMAFLAGAFIITNTGRRAETGD